MAIPTVDVNFLAVIISALVAFIIGGLWYSPILFGNAWMKSSGMIEKDIKKQKSKGMGKMYFIGFLMALVTAYILSHFVQYVGVSTFYDALELACWIWLGFIAPISLGVVLWEGKSFKFYLINVAYNLVSLALMAEILTFWR